MKYKYMYMVTYTFEASGRGGQGRVFISREVPISRPEDIEAIEALQNKRNGFKCAVSGFYLLDKEV